MNEQQGREVHEKSDRKNKPFISIDCSKIDDKMLLESELFGHEKESWKKAYTRKIGLIEVANKGSFHIENFESLDDDTKQKIIETKRYGTVKRIGGKELIEVDVRFIF